MLIDASFFEIFTFCETETCVCVYCANIGYNIMEVSAAVVIQVNDLNSIKPRLNHPFSTQENVCIKSEI